MNTPVSFSIAKLLKEKGLDIEKPNFYNSHGQLKTTVQDFFIPRYEAPTIAEVVIWLYEKHGIWIEGMHCGTFNDFTFKVSRLNKKNIKKEPHYMHDLGKGFNSPTEAYEAAIEYTLKNLI